MSQNRQSINTLMASSLFTEGTESDSWACMLVIGNTNKYIHAMIGIIFLNFFILTLSLRNGKDHNSNRSKHDLDQFQNLTLTKYNNNLLRWESL